jgi:outer membrane protein insertion porin family
MMGYLDRFGIWDMQRCGVKLEHTPGGDDDEVELVLGLRERGRMFLKAGTEVGGGEGGGVGLSLSWGCVLIIQNVTGRIRNALGGGETIEANASLGTKTKSAYQVCPPLLSRVLCS